MIKLILHVLQMLKLSAATYKGTLKSVRVDLHIQVGRKRLQNNRAQITVIERKDLREYSCVLGTPMLIFEYMS